MLIVGHFPFFQDRPSLSTTERHRQEEEPETKKKKKKKKTTTTTEKKNWKRTTTAQGQSTHRAPIRSFGANRAGFPLSYTDPASDQQTVSRLCLCLLTNSTRIEPPLPLSA